MIDELKLLRDYKLVPIKISKNGRGSEKPFKEDLETLYLKYNFSVDELVKYFNVKKPTIERWLRHFNIKKSQELKLIKIKQTCLEKYGKSHYNNRNKAIKTCITKYGVDNISKYQPIKLKKHNTMKQNLSFGASKDENYIFKKLLEKYHIVLRQYKSTLYPFNCDFYIPSIDLYIEYQGFFTHGNEPYLNLPHQKLIIESWKNKNSNFYNNAIKNWTYTDPLKRNIAKINKLNWLEFFNIEDFNNWFSTNKY